MRPEQSDDEVILDAQEVSPESAPTEEEGWQDNVNAPLPSANYQWSEQMNRRPLLTHEQEVELAKRVEQHDEEARNVFIESNFKLVVSIARRYRNVGVPLEDLIQEGNIGLVKAVDHYDYRRGTRFSTYAVVWIEQHIRRSINHLKGNIYVPQNVTEELYRLNRAREELMQELKRSPTIEELAEHLEISVEHVEDLLEIPTDAASLDVLIDEEMETSLGDILKDENATTPEEDLMTVTEEDLAQALLCLPRRDRRIVELRFGLAGEQAHTLDELGKQFDLSRHRVRQIIETALRRVRRSNGRTSQVA
jgi:RNA polymerase primary sigma factor